MERAAMAAPRDIVPSKAPHLRHRLRHHHAHPSASRVHHQILRPRFPRDCWQPLDHFTAVTAAPMSSVRRLGSPPPMRHSPARFSRGHGDGRSRRVDHPVLPLEDDCNFRSIFGPRSWARGINAAEVVAASNVAVAARRWMALPGAVGPAPPSAEATTSCASRQPQPPRRLAQQHAPHFGATARRACSGSRVFPAAKGKLHASAFHLNSLTHFEHYVALTL
mmetsp:Transcript_5676/g.13734  ORF Transcript_5676/g.13734 Transcript_5676/m.13734 type:complete len:221 (-) Transcript_5676:391-1053(-)